MIDGRAGEGCGARGRRGQAEALGGGVTQPPKPETGIETAIVGFFHSFRKSPIMFTMFCSYSSVHGTAHPSFHLAAVESTVTHDTP